jgi:GT2 family glycosyltransferase
MAAAEVTVVIISFNSADVLPACLAALPHGQRLIVVDNASLDASIDVVRATAPWAKIIACPRNEGFGPGANIGLAQVETEFGLLLNADVTPTGEMIQTLVDAARRYPDAGMLAPTVMESGKIQFGRRIFFEPRDRGPAIAAEPAGDICGLYIGGSGMFFPMSSFRAVGGFDEDLFLYYEDDDMCMRMRAAGFGLVQVYAARLNHLGGMSTARIPDLLYWKHWHMAWSRLHMERKYRGRTAMLRHLSQDGTSNLLKYIFRPGSPLRPRYAGRLGGLAAFLAGRRARDVRLGPRNDLPAVSSAGADRIP